MLKITVSLVKLLFTPMADVRRTWWNMEEPLFGAVAGSTVCPTYIKHHGGHPSVAVKALADRLTLPTASDDWKRSDLFDFYRVHFAAFIRGY